MALLYPKTVRWQWNLIGDGEDIHDFCRSHCQIKRSKLYCVYCDAQKRVVVVKVLVVESYPTVFDPMDCSPLSMEFSRLKYWSGLPFPPPRESSQPKHQTWVSHTAGRFFTVWATREASEESKRSSNEKLMIKAHSGTSLVVQWLRLCTPNAGGLSSIPGQGSRSHLLQLKDPACCNWDLAQPNK